MINITCLFSNVAVVHLSMSLDFAILGWLTSGPGSGYDLVRQMDLGLRWFWGANHSQIYPRLRALEDDGLIVSVPVTVGSKLEKRVYSITEAGRRAVQEWASEPPSYPPTRDAERLRLIFGDHGDVKAMRRHFTTHLAHHSERAESLRKFIDVLVARQHPRIEQRIKAAPNAAMQEIVLGVRVLAYTGDLRRAELEVAWATECLAWLDEFERKHHLDDDNRLPMLDNGNHAGA